jgi:hypothetical protein
MNNQEDTIIINPTPIGFFSMIPNVVMESGLSPFAFRLYCQFVRRAGWQVGGACWENTRNLAESCSMSKGMVSKSKKELVSASLIHVEKIARGHGEFSYDRITLIDIWKRNTEHFSTRSLSEQDLITPKDGTVHQERLKNIPSKNYPTDDTTQLGATGAPHRPSLKRQRARGIGMSALLSNNDIEWREWFTEKCKHPAIQAIKKVSGYYPPKNKQVYEYLITELGDTPNMQALEWAHGEWVGGKGGNPQNVLKWVKEGYKRGFYYEIENYLPKPE